MTTTFTAKLTLTDSGNPYSASTSTPVTFTLNYTESFYRCVVAPTGADVTFNLALGANGGIMTAPKFLMIRCISGNGTYTIATDGTVVTYTIGDLNAEGGLTILSNQSTGGQPIDTIVYTPVADSVVEVIAYS